MIVLTTGLRSRILQSGFTLLELVVAMTLMGLVLVMLYNGLRLGLISWERGEQRAAATNRVRLVHEFLRRQLAQSITTYHVDEQRGRFVVFTGQEDAIELVAPMLAQLGQGGLYRIRFLVTEGRFIMRWRPYLPAEPEAGEEREVVLLDKVSAVAWDYFGFVETTENQPDSARWVTRWTNAQRRPQLVRLNLQLQGERWPDLVVTLTEGHP